MGGALMDSFDVEYEGDADFDFELDAYQEREREAAAERAVQGDQQAVRPEAMRTEITFDELILDDYITAEDGSAARWVKVTKIVPPGADGRLAITFQTPQPLGVACEDHWVIDRLPEEKVVIDLLARA